MKTMVFDVPATTGGALTILNQYYDQAVQDIENEWLFVISTPELTETDNVTVLNYPWIKKSWLHRWYFDKFVAHKIVNQYGPDEILSLQNVIIPKTNVKQILYLHQSLPFVKKRYGIFENLRLWIYQNIISKIIFKSIEKADQVIVQTKWMKNACLEKVQTDPEKFVVKQPDVNIEIKQYYKQIDTNEVRFFYPASAFEYKNHQIIVDTVSDLMEKGVNDFKVIFTLKGDENKHISKLLKKVTIEELPIEFIGKISLEEVYEYYSKSILIFPSYIESFPLPLLEARMHKSPILASECPFSHEILDGYEAAKYFNPLDFKELSRLVKTEIDFNRKQFISYEG